MTYARGRRVAQAFVIFASCLFLFSCVGGSNTTPTGTPISITLVSSANTLALGQSVVVTARVYDQNNRGATWTLSPVNFGTLTDQTATSVTYTAPSDFTVPTKITIMATSVSNPDVTSSVQISVSPILVTIAPLTERTINAGEQSPMIASVVNDLTSSGVTWSISPPTGAGTIADVTPSGATYVAPAVVTNPVTAKITVSSIANPSATASVRFTTLAAGAGPNVAALRVDGGPVTGAGRPNAAFTSVTICNPGDLTVCQTIDGILVDTGSVGLRILQSQIPLLKLPTFSDGSGNTLENCVTYPDGSFLWGPVARADVYIAGEVAPNDLLQVITSSNNPVSNGCSNGTLNNLNSMELLGANGILGIGPEPTDCIVAGRNLCDSSILPTPPNLYFSCPSQGCDPTDTAVVVGRDKQVTNPVALFPLDNNGTILQLAPVSSPEVETFGTLTFGIETETNNALGGATVYTTNREGNFTTIFNAQTLSASYIDSGAAEFVFPGLMPTCSVNTKLYCPPALRNLVATNRGSTQGMGDVSFSVDNADTMFASDPGYAVFGSLGAQNATYNSCVNGAGGCTFVWGLPFFYGRSVYTAIDGQFVPFGTPNAPWWAY